MKTLVKIFFLAGMVLLTSTVKAEFKPTEIVINGAPICADCALTEMPRMDCTYPSPLCRVYLANDLLTSVGPIEEMSFTVQDDGNPVPNHWFFLWDIDRGHWTQPLGNGAPGINITWSGDDWVVENTDPYPFYFSSGAGIPVFRASRFSLFWSTTYGFWWDDVWIPFFETADLEIFEIWAPEIH